MNALRQVVFIYLVTSSAHDNKKPSSKLVGCSGLHPHRLVSPRSNVVKPNCKANTDKGISLTLPSNQYFADILQRKENLMQFKIGTLVVHPAYGIGHIVKIEEKQFSQKKAARLYYQATSNFGSGSEVI